MKYKNKILNDNLTDSDLKQLKYFYKALHPDFLLREFCQKDSNELNSKFYNELLYILGLKEVGKGQKLIQASETKGTLRDRICSDLNGCNKFDDVINLIIVWLNRLLFLKLFESQLIVFNDNDKSYEFLNYEKISDFSKLNKLFFNILGKPLKDREEHKIPYLNSSLFERSTLEEKYGNIANLDNETTLPLCKGSILSKIKNYPQKPPLLKYLLDFLGAYNFSSNISAEGENKDIINSSVLGLIFEKLNGYKDGSFFTPAYITEYMSENTINTIVLQKFNQTFKGEKAPCSSIEDLKSLIFYDVHIKGRRDYYNEIIDNLKICDPAVGSGHFLVSVLNYLIALKSELGLLDIQNKIEVQNDSLIIYELDEETQFQYKRNNKNSLTIQKTIFNEKRKIIENCLFGVDINPNSVQICCLRLWIELLKSTYYIDNTDEMQILPNIDINIKCGNSLISKIPFEVNKNKLSAVIGDTLKSLIKDYKKLVKNYKETSDKEFKRRVDCKIEEIKNGIVGKFEQLTIEYEPFSKPEKVVKTDFSEEIYKNSLEWAIEFPELLDENGIFTGFDIVIGNPPYIQLQEFRGNPAQKLYKANFEIHDSNGDIYCLFYEKGINLLKQNGFLCYITSNKWMRAGYGEKLRTYFITKMNPIQLIDFGGVSVFDTANVDVNILLVQKSKNTQDTLACTIDSSIASLNNLSIYVSQKSIPQSFDSNSWCILNPIEQSIKNKIESIGIPLKDWDVNINYGIKTGLNEAFIIGSAKKDELIAKDPKSAEIIRPILRGRDIQKYSYNFADKWLINTHNGSKTQKRVDVNNYLAIKEHLDTYIDKLTKRDDQGDTPYNLRCCAYMDDFNSEIIAWQRITQKPTFCLTKSGSLVLDSMAFISNLDKYKYWLLAVLNSDLIYFWAKLNVHEYGNTGFRLSNQYVEQISVPKINNDMLEKINYLVKAQLENHNKINEQDIQMLVYQAYNISNKDIEVINSRIK